MPKASEIIVQITGGAQSRSLAAWDQVLEAVRTVGAYRTVVFDDPAIMATVWAMGGWPQLCATEQKNLPFVAKEFAARYADRMDRPLKRVPHSLVGLSEADNLLSPWQGDPRMAASLRAVLVGDPVRAQGVLGRSAEAPMLPARNGGRPIDLPAIVREMEAEREEKPLKAPICLSPIKVDDMPDPAIDRRKEHLKSLLRDRGFLCPDPTQQGRHHRGSRPPEPADTAGGGTA